MARITSGTPTMDAADKAEHEWEKASDQKRGGKDEELTLISREAKSIFR